MAKLKSAIGHEREDFLDERVEHVAVASSSVVVAPLSEQAGVDAGPQG